jgi:hypothetical protein
MHTCCDALTVSENRRCEVCTATFYKVALSDCIDLDSDSYRYASWHSYSDSSPSRRYAASHDVCFLVYRPSLYVLFCTAGSKALWAACLLVCVNSVAAQRAGVGAGAIAAPVVPVTPVAPLVATPVPPVAALPVAAAPVAAVAALPKVPKAAAAVGVLPAATAAAPAATTGAYTAASSHN